MKNQKGFTLIELMIVVAIIAILAAIAISQYQDYITKSQFSEAPSISDGMKTAIVEYFLQQNDCPDNSSPGFNAATQYSGKYVESMTLGGDTTTGCTITAEFLPNAAKGIADLTATFTGTDQGGTFAWACGSSVIAPKYLPQACR
jgi:type IV pilus assembly protein PilA